MTKVYIVITHQYCMDGKCASEIAKKHWELNQSNKTKVLYYEMQPNHDRLMDAINKMAKDLKKMKKTPKTIRTFDISFTPESMQELFKLCDDVEVYDHHETSRVAFEDCKDEKLKKAFHHSVLMSGCELAWKHYFGGATMPKLCSYIGDQDTYTFKNPFSVEICAAIYNKLSAVSNKNWQYYLSLSGGFETKMFNELMHEGSIILNIQETAIKRICNAGSVHKVSGKKVFVVNSVDLKSQIGNYAALMQDGHGDKKYDYAAVWHWDAPSNKFFVSLRSDNKDPNAVDVSEIAKKFGGGGHINAAGFELSRIDVFINKFFG